MTRQIDDPIEKLVAHALEARGVAFVHESEDNAATRGLDFYLPEARIFIECKQFHSDRIADQISRAEDVIVIQGAGAAAMFYFWLKGAA